MTAAELAAYIRFKTRTNSVTFPDSYMLPIVKLRMDELSRKLAKSLPEDEDVFLTPHTTNLVASSTSREYTFPSEILTTIKRVEATFDGEEWVRLLPMDISEYRYTHDEETITNNFSNLEGEAKYDIRRQALFIYSGTIIAVTGGLKLWCFDYPAAITDLTDTSRDLATDPTTTTYGFPRELHELLARGVIIDWKESREKPIPLTEREQNYDKDLNMAIQTLRNNDQNREIIGNLPVASERGEDGSNY